MKTYILVDKKPVLVDEKKMKLFEIGVWVWKHFYSIDITISHPNYSKWSIGSDRMGVGRVQLGRVVFRVVRWFN